ncbi:MAG TPA: pantoate--beta-alanine ligase [Gemmatimonadaceae bacterium]|nr:pantoate--beta-alanine ligase [Gemmatimonadaceae bacterium]
MPSTATEMIVVNTIAAVREAVARFRASGSTIAFVPTMGALHTGHISLVERAKKEADITVLSIFVNPLQFGPSEDLSRYPRPVENDEAMAREAGVDILFRPEVREMYPGDREVSVTASAVASDWEGASRPGHFDGVLTVVAKLFNIVQPDISVFGRKDLQQAVLVSAMVHDLDMPLTIIVAPIIREHDGLALSSRNRYLSDSDRRAALSLNQSLKEVRRAFERGERNTAALEAAGRAVLDHEAGVKTDYFAVVDGSTLSRAETADKSFAAIVAARVGSTRLIDNMTLGGDDED